MEGPSESMADSNGGGHGSQYLGAGNKGNHMRKGVHQSGYKGGIR